MSAVWSSRDSALGLSILWKEASYTLFFTGSESGHDSRASFFFFLPACGLFQSALICWRLGDPPQRAARRLYRSCCCRQAFMSLTWRRWEDMSVDRTISITSERSSLEASAHTHFNSWPWIMHMVALGELRYGAERGWEGGYQGSTLFRFCWWDLLVPMVTLAPVEASSSFAVVRPWSSLQSLNISARHKTFTHAYVAWYRLWWGAANANQLTEHNWRDNSPNEVLSWSICKLFPLNVDSKNTPTEEKHDVSL